MHTLITPPAVALLAARHAQLAQRRKLARLKGDEQAGNPACDLPKGLARVRWCNGSVETTDFPLPILARWAGTWPAGQDIGLDVAGGIVTATVGGSVLRLQAAATSAEPVQVSEPVVDVNCDGPRALPMGAVDGVCESSVADELRALRKEAAAASKQAKLAREHGKLAGAVRNTRDALARERAAWHAARKLLARPEGYAERLAQAKRERAARRLVRRWRNALARACPAGAWGQRLFCPDFPAMFRLALDGTQADETSDRAACLYAQWQGTPERFSNKRSEQAVTLALLLAGLVAERVKELCGQAMYCTVGRRRQADAVTAQASLYLERAEYSDARRTVRRWPGVRAGCVARLREAVTAMRAWNARQG